MRAPATVVLVTGLAVAVASAVIITGVRSEAGNAGTQPSTAAVALARAAPGGTPVTVPTLSAAAAPPASDAAEQSAASSSGAQVSAAAAAAESSSSASAAQAGAMRAAAAQRLADQQAAAARAAAKAATARSAASSAAASSAAASSAAASSAAASSAAASLAAASSEAASSAASSSSAAASASSASNSLAAASRSAAADPAPDTTDAVEAAVDAANLTGVTESVLVMNRQSGSVTTSINADAQVPTMSLVKLMLAADVIDQAGGVDQVDDDTLAQLHRMIAVSDDSIAQSFYDADGRGAIITRVASNYGLTGTTPAPNPRYWGDVRVTARDMASLLFQLLSSPFSGLWFTQAMEAAQDNGADGFDQNFGMNAVPGTGSKQGWGCCLDDVLAIHSVGFTAGQIVVVLSTSKPDAAPARLGTAQQLTADPGVRAAVTAVTDTAAAAVG